MLSDKLDPNVRALLEAIRARGAPPLETLDPATARQVAMENMAASALAPEAVASIEDIRIPGPGGGIPVRIYMPNSAAPRPVIVYFHGGGWVLCNLDTHDAVCRAIARRSGATLVSVDYRLAPQHPFPAAVEDAYAATQWVAENAGRLGADPRRMIVAGDSAGGNLATVVCRKSRDAGGPAIAFQALIYPVTDLSSLETESYIEFAEDHQLTRRLMAWFRDHYLPRIEDRVHADASPLLAADLRGLPPALIITAECDPLRDEGEAYATRLKAAGVPVTLTRYRGMIHPFFSLGGAIPQALDAIQQVAGAAASAAPSI